MCYLSKDTLQRKMCDLFLIAAKRHRRLSKSISDSPIPKHATQNHRLLFLFFLAALETVLKEVICFSKPRVIAGWLENLQKLLCNLQINAKDVRCTNGQHSRSGEEVKASANGTESGLGTRKKCQTPSQPIFLFLR